MLTKIAFDTRESDSHPLKFSSLAPFLPNHCVQKSFEMSSFAGTRKSPMSPRVSRAEPCRHEPNATRRLSAAGERNSDVFTEYAWLRVSMTGCLVDSSDTSSVHWKFIFIFVRSFNPGKPVVAVLLLLLSLLLLNVGYFVDFGRSSDESCVLRALVLPNFIPCLRTSHNKKATNLPGTQHSNEMIRDLRPAACDERMHAAYVNKMRDFWVMVSLFVCVCV